VAEVAVCCVVPVAGFSLVARRRLPLGFFAIEAGWVVTEVGRQPWIIGVVMRTADAVTPMPGMIVTFTMFTLVYLALGAIVVWLIGRHVVAIPHQFHAAASPEGRQDDVVA
jgi:cytochrome bd-type quinol oxidase subunit 1